MSNVNFEDSVSKLLLLIGKYNNLPNKKIYNNEHMTIEDFIFRIQSLLLSYYNKSDQKISEKILIELSESLNKILTHEIKFSSYGQNKICQESYDDKPFFSL